MSDKPYLGLNPFSEKDAPFFFGRDVQKRAIARSLRLLRLTLLFGESGVGKSSILQAGVVPLFRRDAEQNSQDYGTPQLAIVVFRDWHSDNPLQELLEEIRASVAKAMGIKPTDLEDGPTPVESLQVWTKILGEEGRGQLFLILDQFEEYFQSHPQESGEGTFADEFPRWVNRSDLRVNFLIAMREDAHAKLHRFHDRILNIFDKQIELQRLDRSAARDAIVKPIGEYNLRQIIADHLQTSRLTVLSAASGMGKSRVLRAIADDLRKKEKGKSITFSSWRGNPVADLVRQVETDLKALFPNISDPEPGTSLTETLQRWAERIAGRGGNSQLFIILDQFEEFFHYQPPEMGEGSFVAEFSQAVNDPKLLPVHFLISIRDEAQDRLKRFRDRIPNIFDHLLQIKQLGENPAIADLVKPIEEPAQQLSKAIGIEPELVEEVLKQIPKVSSEAVTPPTSQENVKIEAPYLQLVMERLWEEEMDKKDSRCLRRSTLEELGGAEKIVEAHLNERMDSLTESEREAAATVFEYLVSSSGTKIAYPVFDLVISEGLDQTVLQSLLDKLDHQRILRTVKAPNHADLKRYEIFHDRLAPAILKWREQYLLDKKLKEEEEKGKQKAKEEEEKGKQKAKERVRLSTLIGVVILGTSFVAGIYTSYVSRQMRNIQKEISSMEEADKVFEAKPRSSGQIEGLIQAMGAGKMLSAPLKNPWLTLNLLLDSKNSSDTAIKYLNEILKKIQEKNYFKVPIPQDKISQDKIISSSFSPHKKLFAISYSDGTVQLRTVEREQDSRNGRIPASSLSFNPKGDVLAVGFSDGTVQLWTVEGKKYGGNEIPIPVSKDKIQVSSLSFNPKGDVLAVGYTNGTVQLWTVEGKKDEKNIDKSSPSSLSFNPKGDLLAIGLDDGSIHLLIVKKDKETLEDEGKLLIPSLGDGPVRSISFSNDGNNLIAIYQNRFVRFWDIQEKKPEGNNLEELLNRGCDWLDDYLKDHPQKKDDICP